MDSDPVNSSSLVSEVLLKAIFTTPNSPFQLSTSTPTEQSGSNTSAENKSIKATNFSR